jgi:hypothetical protein
MTQKHRGPQCFLYRHGTFLRPLWSYQVMDGASAQCYVCKEAADIRIEREMRCSE